MKKSGVGFIRDGKMEPLSKRNYDFALQAFEDGTKITWTIENYRRERSLGQNNLFHWLVDIIAKEIGEDRHDLKEWFKKEYGVWIEMTDRNGNIIVNEDTGEIAMKPKPTSDYDTLEKSTLIDSVYRFGDKLGIRLPDPEEARNNNIKF